jgi:hypothetical protein
MSRHEYVHSTERVGDLIVQVVADSICNDSPREWDNLTCIYGSHRSYTIGDGDPPPDEKEVLERGGIRLLYRWLRRYKSVVAFKKLAMYDHSGISFYTVNMGSDGHHAFDAAGWDSGVVGYVYITKKRLEEMGSPIEKVEEYLEQEVETYNSWATGDVWGYVVTKPCDHDHDGDSDEEIAACPHSERLDSCWGYIGDAKYALEEGISVAKWSSEHGNVSAHA